MSYLKVHAIRADHDGCWFYRMHLPTEEAKKHGVEVTEDDELDAVAWADNDDVVSRVERVDVDADVIVFSRPLYRHLTLAIEQAQKQGIACVVDIDDDMHAISPNNAAYWAVHPKTSPHSNWEHLARSAEIADWVTVSTPALAERYGKHGRVSIIRNSLPESVFDIEKQVPDRLRVGWTGTVNTHPNDLEAAGVHVGTALKNNDLEFSIIGDGYQVREKLGISEHTKFNEFGWTLLEDYLPALSECIDIGIVPLEMSRFNQAKSYLKGLEMAGCGIPFIASPTDEYKFLHSLGAGRTAKKGIDWQKHITALSSNKDFYLEESERHRTVARHLVIANFVEMWISAWVSALENLHSKGIRLRNSNK